MLGLGLIGLALVASIQPCTADDVLVDLGEEWVFFRGRSEPSPDPVTSEATTGWTEIDFDDSTWESGPTGIGYADGDDQTVLSDMRDAYLSVYARKFFEVDPGLEISALVLSIDYDDGFVAYLNGVEVTRSGLTGVPPAFDETASSHEAGTAETFAIDAGLIDDENVLAIQVHNTNLTSSDLSLSPILIANPDLCPSPASLSCTFNFVDQSVTLNWTNETDYDLIEIRRDGEVLDAALLGTMETFVDTAPITGATATYSVVAVRGAEECPPMECDVFGVQAENLIIKEGDDWKFLRGLFDPPLDWMQPGFDDSQWEVGPTGIGYGDGDDMTELLDMRAAGAEPGYLAVFCRHEFQVTDMGRVTEGFLSILYDDGVVVYLNGEEIGRANMPAGDPTSATSAQGATPEPSFFEVTIPKESILEGTNLLAVSVHNTSLTSSDLSFIPIFYVLRSGDPPDGLPFRRGDSDNSGSVNISDSIVTLRFLFQGGETLTCFEAADVDDSGSVNITDPISLLNFLFKGHAPPPAPGHLNCGLDLTDDDLVDCSTLGC